MGYCSSDFENSCCCTYYGEKRESGAALLPPTSLIAANKRDYLPDPCFLHTGGSTSPSRKPLCCDRGTESAPAIRYRSPCDCTYAAGAVSKCVWQDPTGGGPPDWVLRGETPTEAQYIQSGQRPAQRIHAAIEKLPRAHTRCRGGRPLNMGDWYGECVSLWLWLHP